MTADARLSEFLPKDDPPYLFTIRVVYNTARPSQQQLSSC